MPQIIRLFLFITFTYVSLSLAFAKVEKDYSVDNKSTYHLGHDIDLVSVSDVKYYKPIESQLYVQAILWRLTFLFFLRPKLLKVVFYPKLVLENNGL